MSNIDRITNWEAYENGESDAKNILYRSGDVLTRIGQAIDEFSNDETLSKPGQLSYKFGYLDAITRALKDESERVKNDIMTFYIKGDNENGESDNYIGTAGNIGHDGCSTDPGCKAGDI